MHIGIKDKENKSNTHKDISIYTQGSPLSFGYKYNVNHPLINDLYRRYKKWKGIPESSPMSNAQRADFESYIDKYLAENEIAK